MKRFLSRVVCVGAASLLACASLSSGQGHAESLAPRVPWAYPEMTTNIEKQMEYVHRWWNGKNLAMYGFIPDNDCANFASQSLAARGWQMSDEWFATRTVEWNGNENDGGWDYDAASAWVSSRDLHHYLSSFPDRARLLDDSQRDEVKVGDIVQFDWSPEKTPTGTVERDHTGIVTRVDMGPGGVTVMYAAHTQGISSEPDAPTQPTEFYSVDQALADRGGGAVSYWSILTP